MLRIMNNEISEDEIKMNFMKFDKAAEQHEGSKELPADIQLSQPNKITMKKTLAIVFALLCTASVNAKQYVKNVAVDIDATFGGTFFRHKNNAGYTDVQELQKIIENLRSDVPMDIGIRQSVIAWLFRL